MKTVNFLEALGANKTKRVRYKAQFGESIYHWFAVAELRNAIDQGTRKIRIPEFEGLWEIEPEIVVIDNCKWSLTQNNFVYPKADTDFKFTDLIGKKTKVTIEVIE